MHAKMNGWAGVCLVTHCLNTRPRTYVALKMLAFARTPRGMPSCLFNKVWVSRYVLVLILIACASEGSTSSVIIHRPLNCSTVTRTAGQNAELCGASSPGCNVTQWGRYENGSTLGPWCTLWGPYTRVSLRHRVAFGCSLTTFFIYNVSQNHSGTYYRKGDNCTDQSITLSCFNLTVRPQAVQSTTMVTPTVVTNATANVSLATSSLTINSNASGHVSYQRQRRVENGTLFKNITNLAFTYGSWGVAMLLFAAVMVLVDLGLPQSAWRRWRSHVDDEERGLLT